MSKSKDSGAENAILDYLNKQNRPYSANDIFMNLHKAHGKTAVVKALEALAQDGKIKEKVYGKQKVYVADQAQFPVIADSELKGMDGKITQLTEKLNATQAVNKQLDSELRGLKSSLSTKDALLQSEELKQECGRFKAKLEQLKAGGKSVSPEEKDRINTSRTKYVKAWRKRKRLANDILGAILEGYPKTKKQLYEDIGIETDEECKVTPPEL